MKKYSCLLGTVLLFGAHQAFAQLPAVISAPIAEKSSRSQITHQTVTSIQMTEGKGLAAAMTKVSGQIKGVIDVTQQMHDQWYSSLLAISSGVRNYRRVKEIYDMQVAMISTYATVRTDLARNGLTPDQLTRAGSVYSALLQENVGLISELMGVLSPAKAKMTDPERLDFINNIADRMQKQQALMSYFTSKCQAIAQQQSQAVRDQAALQAFTK
jgi:hypothetical protein